MNPAFSVIFLTTLIGVGQGLFLALITGQTYATAQLLPAQDSVSFYGVGSLIALLFLLAGLISSIFHLGHPERAWRSVAMWRTSWLSREVIVLPTVMLFVALYAAVHYFQWDRVIFTSHTGVDLTLSFLLGSIGAFLVFILFLCTAMIYACIKFLQEWSTPLTVANYFFLGTASGFTLASAFAFQTAPDLVNFYAGWAIVFTVVAFFTRTASLIRNNRLKPISSVQTAIGIRHEKIQQKSMGAMGGSFNTREYVHGMPVWFLKATKWIFLLLVFPVPLILMMQSVAMDSFSLAVIAFLVQFIGLIFERWYFFAQANHPQNLYYQTI